MRSFLFAASLVAVGLAGPVALQAQPAEWGEVPRDQLDMTAFPADSSATAVILSDAGRVHFNRRGRLVYERHTRIKILSESGYDWGTVELTYRDEDGMERVEDIEGQTFTRAEDGTVARHVLDGNDVFDEDVDGTHARKRFTLPALAPGAVIEYRYEIEKRNPILMPEWTFQTSEPTQWSEYEVVIPNDFEYVRLTRGAPEFVVEGDKGVHGPLGPSHRHRWAVRDVPALREEPFVTTLDDYRMGIAFQLQRYVTRRGQTEDFMTSWEDLADDLLGHSDFGRQLRKGGDVQTRAELVVGAEEDGLEKMKALYDYVRTRIEWNGTPGIFPERDVDEVLEAQSGSGPGIALLLTAMLRHVGLEAHPVLISTRAHGKMQPVYPYLAQFNGVLVYVEVEGTAHLLDATAPLRTYDLLPVRALNGLGWMVTEGGGQWIEITPRPYRRRVNVVGAVAADGSVEAEIQAVDAMYSALRRRQVIAEEGAEAFVRDVLLEDLGDVEVASHEIEQMEAIDEPLITKVTFRAPGYAQAAGDFLYLNPTLIDRRDESPLHAPTRTFPVDFAYPRDLTYALMLQLPEGFTVQEMPEDIQVPLLDGGGVFQRVTEVRGGRMTLQTRLIFASTRFEPAQYEALRAFYERITAAQVEQVVLRRTDEATEAADQQPAGGDER